MGDYLDFFNSGFGPGSGGTNKHKRPRFGKDERLRIFSEGQKLQDQKYRLICYLSLRLSRKSFIENVDKTEIPNDLLRLVPSVDEMNNNNVEAVEANTVSDIHLANTSLVTLESVQFFKLWKLRECASANVRKGQSSSFDLLGGPFDILYKKVFQIEVKDGAGDIIMVYFYGDWAIKLYEILDPLALKGSDQANDVRLTFKSIPAKCIAPNDSANVNEGDSLLCIGTEIVTMVIGNSCKIKSHRT